MGNPEMLAFWTVLLLFRLVISIESTSSQASLAPSNNKNAPSLAVENVSSEGSGSNTSTSTGTCEYSFFYLTYRQPLAARLLFLRVREFYPTSPIYILTDKGGIDLSSFCEDDVNPSKEFCQAHTNAVHNGHAVRDL